MNELIISIYDFACRFSVMKNGKLLLSTDWFVRQANEYDTLFGLRLTSNNFKRDIQKMYPDYRIVICEDGEIWTNGKELENEDE